MPLHVNQLLYKMVKKCLTWKCFVCFIQNHTKKKFSCLIIVELCDYQKRYNVQPSENKTLIPIKLWLFIKIKSTNVLWRSSEVDREEEEAQLSEVDQPPIIQLAASIWIGILAHSTFLCYFMVFLHQIRNASVLSTPLPLMVFFWGSLTIPRPTKSFWITMIAYIEVW